MPRLSVLPVAGLAVAFALAAVPARGQEPRRIPPR